MGIAAHYLSLASEQRAFLYAVGSTQGAQHIERLLMGCAAVWVDAQTLSTNEQDQVWVSLQNIWGHEDSDDLLPYVFQHAVLLNQPKALQKVCQNCTNTSTVFTSIGRLLKDLQMYPSLPLHLSDFCDPLLALVPNDNYLKTLTTVLCNTLCVRMEKNESCTDTVLTYVVRHTANKLSNTPLLAEVLFSQVYNWNMIAQRFPTAVEELISHTPLDTALLFGGVPYHNQYSFDKWREFLHNGVDPTPIAFDDGGFPFEPRSHKSWLGFLDVLLPLYQKFNHDTPLLHLLGMEAITTGQEGLAVNEYQNQKLRAAVENEGNYCVKISKI